MLFLAIRKRLDQRDDGFTLIELLIVVIIIGILAAIAIPTFLSQRNRAFEASAQSSLRNAAVAQQSYFTEQSTYTKKDTDLIGEGWVKDAKITTTLKSADGSGYVMCSKHADGGDLFKITQSAASGSASIVRATSC